MGADIEDINEDHYTFIKIISTADSNKIKTEALRRRYEAIAQSGQMAQQQAMDQQQQGGQSAGLNASMAQQASSMMQQ
jgi:vacuolar-type H+-ATPase subunit E/Vma4